MSVSAQEAARRLREAGTMRSDRYAMGTEGKGSKWESSKGRAKSNFQPAMQAALSSGAYDKGLDRASASDYDSGVRNKGRANWSVGMQSAEAKYTKNISPFVSLWSAPLPTAGGPRGSAQNIKRMTENVERFRKAKTS
jgi:hypothetical protein